MNSPHIDVVQRQLEQMNCLRVSSISEFNIFDLTQINMMLSTSSLPQSMELLKVVELDFLSLVLEVLVNHICFKLSNIGLKAEV